LRLDAVQEFGAPGAQLDHGIRAQGPR
jgi:hypothetical protein